MTSNINKAVNSASIRSKAECSSILEDKVMKSSVFKNFDFTEGMLRDQETLILTLKQQGIPDDLIDRQFNRLLEEQQKQLLRYLEPTEVSNLARPSKRLQYKDNRSRLVIPAIDIGEVEGQSLQERGKELSSPETTSLSCEVHHDSLRLRNNGLQAPSKVQRMPQSRHRRCHLNREHLPVRLDGTQDSNGTSKPPGMGCDRSNKLTPLNVPLMNGLQDEDYPTTTSDEPVSEKQSQSTQPPQEEVAVAPPHLPAKLQEPRLFGGFTYLARI